ncbi:MAG: hypothetical protein HRT74_05195, partial [Flavobacteriales bacterium]|nr:hypothetical protein [Flavobacteriales bacterium]
MMSSNNSFKEILDLLHHCLGKANDKEVSDVMIAGKCLQSAITYRLPESAKTDPMIGFRMMKRCLNSLNLEKKSVPQGKLKQIAIQGNSNNEDRILKYISFQTGIQTPFLFSKENASQYLPEIPLQLQQQVKKVYLSEAAKCIYHKDRQHRSIWVWAALEAYILLEFCKKHEVETVVDFSPYLIDANFYTLLLRKNGINVVKVPSSGPLKAHNKYMIGDLVALSTPYQFLELEKFQETITVKKVEKWIPERALEYVHSYIHEDLPEPEPLTIGFYSHAAWLRKEEGHSDNGLNIHAGEMQLL